MSFFVFFKIVMFYYEENGPHKLIGMGYDIATFPTCPFPSSQRCLKMPCTVPASNSASLIGGGDELLFSVDQ